MDYDSNDVNRSTVTYPRISAGIGGIGRYTLFMQTAAPGVFSSITSTPNTTEKTKVKNNEKFMLGKVYYSNRGSDLGSLNVSDTSNSWMDQQTSLVDLKYSLNIANGELTAREPLFLVGTLTDDGYFRLADETWWTQEPIEADDGTVYIYVGQVYPDSQPYRCTLDLNNPAIWYKDNGWKPVVQYAAKTEVAVSAQHAGSAGYATTASNAGYAGQSGAAVTAGNAVLAGTASWALLANTANRAILASCANNAVTAGGAITASRAFFSSSAGYVTTAQNAVTANQAIKAGCAAHAVTAGRALYSTSAGYVTTAQNAVTAGYASMANEVLGNHSTLNNITLAANTTADYVWFNLFPDAYSGASADYAYPITSYRFGNKQAGYAGVELKADFFSGKASCAGWATSAGWASSAGYAASAANATNANSAAHAVTAGRALYSNTANNAVTAGRALYSNTANNAVTAGRSLYANTANNAVTAGRALSAGSATFATTAGNATDDTKVLKAGDTMSGPLTITHTANSTTGELKLQYGDTIDFWLGTGSANVNHGLYDVKKNAWVLAASATNAWYFYGQASCAAYALKSASAARAVTAGRAISSASAGYAASAAQATHAASAGFATTASNATNAGVAESSGSATYAAQSTTAGNAGVAGKADAANITTTNNAVAIYTNTAGAFGTIQSKAGAFYATATNVKPVFGTLPAAYGGTGKTTLVDGANAFINALTSGTSVPVDNDYYIAQWVNGGTNTAIYVRRTHNALWGYIENKIGSAAYVKSVAGKTGPTVTLSKLTVGHKEYNGSSDIEIKAADLDLAKSMTFLGKTTTAISDGSTTTTVSITVNGTTTNHTAENGDVVIYDGEEFIYSSTAGAWQSLGLASSYALHNHTHGNISSGGKVSTSAAIATGDSLLIGDASDSNGVTRSTITFDATKTGYALTQAGTWAAFNNYSLPNASSTTKGGVKIGDNLTIDSNAVLSLTSQNIISALGYNPAESGGAGIEYVVGTQAVQTSAWTGVTTESALETGKVIAYKIPQASSAGAAVSLTLTLAGGGTAAKWVLLNGSTALTTQYPANSVVILTYDGSAWRVADYDSNTDTFVRQELKDATDATSRPLLLAVRDSTDTTTSVTGIAYRSNAIYANPSTGKITATGFVGALEGQASCANYATTAAGSVTAGNAILAGTATWGIQANCAAHSIHAGSATYSASAAQATHAASAGYATSASQAIYAGSASYATTAVWAVQANCASHAIHAGSATYAVSASQATHAASAGYATSAAQATHAASANYSTTALHAGTAGKLTASNNGNYLNPIFLSTGTATATAGKTIPFIVGTGTTAGTWTGTLTGLTAYYDGLLILYKSPVAGANPTTLQLNSLEAKQVYLNNTTALTTHYPVNQPILLVYSASTNSGCWVAVDNYDSNTTPYGVRVYRQTSGYNDDYPLLVSRSLASAVTATNGGYLNNVYGVLYSTNIPTLNPSTGMMKVPGGITANLTGKASSAGYAASAAQATHAASANYATSAAQATHAASAGYAAQATNIYSAASTSKAYVLGTLTASSAMHGTVYAAAVYTQSGVLYGACWNDYAEFRWVKAKVEPGRCVVETGNDDMVISNGRMQPGAEIVSDTFGYAIGETDQAKTPVAMTGRVLAYPFEPISEFRKNIGHPVCSGPNGTVSIMTDKEYQEKGYCAIGTISAVPDYDTWEAGENRSISIPVNGRVWIRVK